MLNQVAEGVWVHESEFLQSNSTLVQGRDGLLLVDPGITGAELDELAADIRELGQPVIAGFSTHPDWDHVLWNEAFGDVPRFATSSGAASMRDLLAKGDWRELVAGVTPPEHAGDIPLDLFGQLTPLPDGTIELPWNGPRIRIIEHRAHAEGHAALLIEPRRVLIAGDMLSDSLMPFLDLDSDDPLGDYLAALALFDGIADAVDVIIPGHGSVGDANELRARIDRDRAYSRALLDGTELDDPRVGPDAPLYWLPDVHHWQVQRLAEKSAASGTAG